MPILHEPNNFFLEHNAVGFRWHGKNNVVLKITQTPSEPVRVADRDMILFAL